MKGEQIKLHKEKNKKKKKKNHKTPIVFEDVSIMKLCAEKNSALG